MESPIPGSLFRSNNSKTLYFFIHGYGGTKKDLSGLIRSFHEQGNDCIAITLPGHETNCEDLLNYNYEDMKDYTLKCIGKVMKSYRNIYLVGFSIGSTIAIEISQQTDLHGKLKGIIGISTFLGPAQKFNYAFGLGLCKLLRMKRVRKYPSTTNKKARKDMAHYKYVPVDCVLDMLSDSKGILERLKSRSISVPTVLFHSYLDDVANYRKVKELVQSENELKPLLVSFRELNHFLQHDMSPDKMASFTNEFFKNNGDKNAPQKLLESDREINQKRIRGLSRSLVIMMLLFNSLLGFSIFYLWSKVSTINEIPPSIFISYSVIISIFGLVTFRYLYQIDRTKGFRRHYLELLNDNPNGQKDRSAEKGSKVFPLIMCSLVFITQFIALAGLSFVFLKNDNIFFSLGRENIAIELYWLLAVLLSAVFTVILVRYLSHHRMEMYILLPMGARSPSFMGKIMELRESIDPGKYVL